MTKKLSSSLRGIRDKIDRIDGKILELLNRRAQHAVRISSLKKKNEPGVQCYRPERETELLRRLMRDNAGPLSDESIAAVFREIMSACRALEEEIQVGYLGPPGTFTEEATHKHFGQAVKAVGLKDIPDVFRAVESGEIAYGVVPVENSIEGVVTHTLDQFIVSPLHVVGEVQLAVHHHLLTRAADVKKIKEVFAHRQAFSQCRRWLTERLSHAVLTEVSSSSEATRRAAGNKTTAAIGGASAAAHYDVPILARRLEDHADNTTRFLVIGNHEVPSTGDDKTSLLVSLRNQPGALLELLQPLAKHKVSMTRIESRPAGRTNWEYVFFLDIEGHRDNARQKKALRELKTMASLFKLLGSYPRATD